MERDELKLQPTLINGQKDDLTEGLSRRSFFMAAGAAGVGGTAALLSSTSAQAQSTDWTQPGNNNGVIELQILNGGDSYSITDPTMPIMALIAVPTGPDPWNPTNLWPGMQPYPENFADADGNKVYTFLNICFVNVKSVGVGGEILELEINSSKRS